MYWLRKNVAGIILSLLIAVVANWLGSEYPLVGGPVFGILLGIIVSNFFGKPDCTKAGIMFTSQKNSSICNYIFRCGIKFYSGSEYRKGIIFGYDYYTFPGTNFCIYFGKIAESA